MDKRAREHAHMKHNRPGVYSLKKHSNGRYVCFLEELCIVTQVVLLAFGHDFPSMKYLQMRIIKLHIEII